MVTFVGTQSEFSDMLKDLVELELDAAQAYEKAIEKLEKQAFKEKFQEFLADHHRHTEELSKILTDKGYEPPDQPSAKQWLTQGKVILGSLIGDKAILTAMRSNEEDTNTAYERANARKDMWVEVGDVLDKALNDEHHHRDWIIHTLNNL